MHVFRYELTDKLAQHAASRLFLSVWWRGLLFYGLTGLFFGGLLVAGAIPTDSWQGAAVWGAMVMFIYLGLARCLSGYRSFTRTMRAVLLEGSPAAVQVDSSGLVLETPGAFHRYGWRGFVDVLRQGESLWIKSPAGIRIHLFVAGQPAVTDDIRNWIRDANQLHPGEITREMSS